MYDSSLAVVRKHQAINAVIILILHWYIIFT